MQVFYINGRVERLSWRELRALLFHAWTLTLFVLGVLAFRTTPVAADIPALPPRIELLFWMHVAVQFFGIYIGVAWWCDQTGRRLFTPLLHGLIAAVLTATGTAFFVLAGGMAVSWAEVAVFWLALWSMLLMGELAFMTFLYDRLFRPATVGATAAHAPLQVLFVTGRREAMTLRNLRAAVLHPAAVGVTLLGLLGLMLFHPYEPIRTLPLDFLTLLWAHVLAGFYLVFFGVAWLCRRLGLPFVVPVALAVVAVVVTSTARIFLALTTGIAAPLPLVLGHMLFHWAAMVLAEFVIVTFCMDRILRDMAGPLPVPAAGGPRGIDLSPQPRAAAANGAAPRPPEARVLVLQGVAVPVDEVLHVTAEEHYLRLVTADRSRLLRGRMTDIEAGMPQGLGLRVHRSHWVARKAVSELKRDDSGWVLRLTDGAVLPVARGRQAAVRAWLAAREG